jgi:uncharacterized beta-barrel protein YwiB (DUF1934 family)
MSLNRNPGKKVSINFHMNVDPSAEYEGLRSTDVLKYEGKYYEQEDGFYVIYEDSGAKASIKKKGDVYVVSNAGNSGNRMTFDEKNYTRVNYQTQAGPIELEVRTTRASVMHTEEKIVLKMDYKLYAGGEMLSRYKPVIEIEFVE